jgi:hypothetical protein
LNDEKIYLNFGFGKNLDFGPQNSKISKKLYRITSNIVLYGIETILEKLAREGNKIWDF